MPFPLAVRREALIACKRHCVLCEERKHTHLQCHHIIQKADNGPDTLENCIPLCPDCHSQVSSFNSRHPIGCTPYSKEELYKRRDDWYALMSRKTFTLGANLQNPNYPKNLNLMGTAAFNYSNNDGFFQIGEGNSAFLTNWSKAGKESIHCYRDGTNVTLALATWGSGFNDITHASALDFSSRVRTPKLEQIIVFENHESRFAVVKIRRIQDDNRGDDRDWLMFDYMILDDGSDDFSKPPIYDYSN